MVDDLGGGPDAVVGADEIDQDVHADVDRLGAPLDEAVGVQQQCVAGGEVRGSGGRPWGRGGRAQPEQGAVTAGQQLRRTVGTAQHRVRVARIDEPYRVARRVDLGDLRGRVHTAAVEQQVGLVAHRAQVVAAAQQVLDDGLQLGHRCDRLGAVPGDVADHHEHPATVAGQDVVEVAAEPDDAHRRLVVHGDVDAGERRRRRQQIALQLHDHLMLLLGQRGAFERLPDHLDHRVEHGRLGGPEHQRARPVEHEVADRRTRPVLDRPLDDHRPVAGGLPTVAVQHQLSGACAENTGGAGVHRGLHVELVVRAGQLPGQLPERVRCGLHRHAHHDPLQRAAGQLGDGVRRHAALLEIWPGQRGRPGEPERPDAHISPEHQGHPDGSGFARRQRVVDGRRELLSERRGVGNHHLAAGADTVTERLWRVHADVLALADLRRERTVEIDVEPRRMVGVAQRDPDVDGVHDVRAAVQHLVHYPVGVGGGGQRLAELVDRAASSRTLGDALTLSFVAASSGHHRDEQRQRARADQQRQAGVEPGVGTDPNGEPVAGQVEALRRSLAELTDQQVAVDLQAKRLERVGLHAGTVEGVRDVQPTGQEADRRAVRTADDGQQGDAGERPGRGADARRHRGQSAAFRLERGREPHRVAGEVEAQYRAIGILQREQRRDHQ